MKLSIDLPGLLINIFFISLGNVVRMCLLDNNSDNTLSVWHVGTNTIVFV